MITIFSIPKGFNKDAHVAIIQENAIRSWIALGAEVFLMGNDPGVAEFSAKVGAKHFPETKVNEFGTPLLDDAFRLARENSNNNILMYTNADMVYSQSLLDSLDALPKGEFLAVGQRTDTDITELLSTEEIVDEAEKSGSLHFKTAIDYFIFPKTAYRDIPPFAVGRVGWDIWMTGTARKKKIPLIDMTKAVLAVHQNHGYPSYNKGKERKTNPEATKNNSYTKDLKHHGGIAEATHKVTKKGLSKRKSLWLYNLKKLLK